MCAQLPVILHGKNTIGDSYFIIKYLEQTYPEVVTQASPEEQAMSVAVQHLVDDFLNKGLGYYRWVHPKVIHPCHLHTLPTFFVARSRLSCLAVSRSA